MCEPGSSLEISPFQVSLFIAFLAKYPDYIMDSIIIPPGLTPVDRLVLQNLASSFRNSQPSTTVTGLSALPVSEVSDLQVANDETSSRSEQPAYLLLPWAVPTHTQRSLINLPRAELTDEKADLVEDRDHEDVCKLQSLNNPSSQGFEPTVFSSWDLRDLRSCLPPAVYQHILLPYMSWAQGVARYKTDVVMVTHLIMYFSTSLPSAIWLLFYRFSYWHGIIHLLMQVWYTGAYTLLRHQHIHQRGVLAKSSWMRVFDSVFPYVMDPLMGHTWNSYFYHHVKHHHVEGNGPDDLSSTIRYQRDNVWHFLHYVGRFYFLVWLDLPLYFIKKGQYASGLRAGFWDLSSYAAIFFLLRYNFRAALFTHLLPLLIMRVGLMAGNWGQHAFVDPDEPDSDYRSSISLIDVAVSIIPFPVPFSPPLYVYL